MVFVTDVLMVFTVLMEKLVLLNVKKELSKLNLIFPLDLNVTHVAKAIMVIKLDLRIVKAVLLDILVPMLQNLLYLVHLGHNKTKVL